MKNWLTTNPKADLFGGVTAAVTALPLAIAFGVLALAPLGPEYASTGALAGLYGAIFTGIFAALFGGTPCQVTGPTGPMTTIMTAVVAGLMASPPVDGTPEEQIQAVLVLTFLCVVLGGLVQISFSFLGVGALIKYIPYPVIAGFMNGIAIIIFLGQVKPFLGVGGDSSWTDLLAFDFQPLTIAVGAVTILALVVTSKVTKSVPGSLAGLALGTAFYYLFVTLNPDGAIGPVIGQIPSGIPLPTNLKEFAAILGNAQLVAALPRLIFPALALGVLGSIDSLLTSVVADTVTRTRHDSNRELLGQGIGNVISGIFGGLAGAGATVRTLVNVNAGGRGRLSGAIHGVALLLVLLLFGKLAGGIPNVVLAGILLVTAVGMVDRWSRLLAFKLTGTPAQKREILINLAVVLAVTVVTVAVDLMVAVGLGIIAACLLFVEKMSGSAIRRVYRGDVWHSRRVLPLETMKILAREGRGTLVAELRGPLFFGTADRLATEIQDQLDGVERVILDFRRVTEVDSTGARVILLLEELLEDSGRGLVLSSVDACARGFLQDMGVVEAVGEEAFFADTDRALEWAEDRILEKFTVDDDDGAEQALEQLECLHGLSPEQREIFLQHLVHEEFPAGELVIRQGEPSDCIYILVKGTFSVTRRLDNEGDRRLATFGPGSVAGEQAMLEGRPRSADVRADEPAAAYRLSRENWDKLMADHPAVAARFLWNIGVELSARLRNVHAELVSLEG